MADHEFDILGEIDWDNMLVEIPDDVTLLNLEPPVVTDERRWIGEIESILMKDDDDKVDSECNQQSYDNFLADILVDSPPDGSGEVLDKDSDESADKAELNNDDSEGADDPVSKKRKRQLRNRDAAVRSRERKKMYVKDLEMKSKYLEAECRRLGRLLQCFVAENQALRLSVQNGNAFGASTAKQESAVLLLESLLLGSLLWFLGIMCLFILPTMPQSDLAAVPLVNVEKKGPGSLAPREAGSKISMSSVVHSFLKSRRCKGSRTKMRMRLYVPRVLA